jgi:hypothetical protein
MDIARAFSDSGLAQGVTINIKGTPDDPLFQASQIGALLGLCYVRDAIKDFDEEELRVGLQQSQLRMGHPIVYRHNFPKPSLIIHCGGMLAVLGRLS